MAERAATTLRPAGAFGRLDAVASWLAAWQWSTTPQLERPAVVVFGADHGVTAEGVSAYPGEVTQAMVAAMDQGVATVTALAGRSVRRSRSTTPASVARQATSVSRTP